MIPPDTTPIHLIAWYGQLELVEPYVHQMPFLVNFQDKYGNTPCHYATLHGHLQCLQTLITFKANLLLYNNAGQTCLSIMNEGKLELKEDPTWDETIAYTMAENNTSQDESISTNIASFVPNSPDLPVVNTSQ